jgi:hypothetical protein
MYVTHPQEKLIMTMRDRPEMELVLDQDVRAVCEFMLANMPAAKLVSVAKAMAEIAPVLWGHYPAEEIRALSWRWAPILACDPHTQSVASEYALAQSYAGGDSAAAVDGLQ